MSEKINCLLEKYNNINVRIAILKNKANKIKDEILKETINESRQNAAEQPRG